MDGNRQSRRAVLAAVVAGTTAIAGCGGSTDGNGSDPTGTTTATATDRATTTATETDEETATETETDRETTTEAPDITIEAPATSLVDERIDVRLTGVEPGTDVVLRSRTEDVDTTTWTTEATFRADDEGVVAVGEQAPESGPYGEDPMGWLWAMTPESDDSRYFPSFRTGQMSVTLEATTDAGTVTKRLRRQLWKPSVVERPIGVDGVSGYVYEPPGEGPHPGVLALHGSGGRPLRWRGSLLASHGYTTAALRYFGDDSAVPDDLVRVPLSYFDDAASWLRSRDGVRDAPVGLYGVSRGGELALLLGARFDWPGAVVADVPSGIVWSGNQPGEPAWTDGGEPVPYLTFETGDSETVDGRRRWRPAFETALSEASADERDRATIAVEDTGAPVTLISGGDDQVWPSTPLSAVAVDRLESADASIPLDHRAYEGAGHLIIAPYQPTAGRDTGPRWVYGGTAEGYARADVGGWEGTLSTLSAGLKD